MYPDEFQKKYQICRPKANEYLNTPALVKMYQNKIYHFLNHHNIQIDHERSLTARELLRVSCEIQGAELRQFQNYSGAFTFQVNDFSRQFSFKFSNLSQTYFIYQQFQKQIRATPQKPLTPRDKKYLLVLDLDQTLIYKEANCEISIRPYLE